MSSQRSRGVGRSRDPYPEVGQAMRAAVERARDVQPRLTVADRAVLDAVFVLLASYSRLADRVFVMQIAVIAGVHERIARASLRRLADVGVIGWRTVQGSQKPSLLTLTGALRPDETPGESGPLSPGDSGPLSPGHSGPDTEKLPEKFSEESTIDWIDYTVGAGRGMTFEAAANLVGVLRAAYFPQKFPDDKARLYTAQLQRLDYELAGKAIDGLLSRLTFVPTLAEIHEAYRAETARHPAAKTADSAPEAILSAQELRALLDEHGVGEMFDNLLRSMDKA